MPVMMEKLYDALRSGDVPDDKARAAASEAADDYRLARIEANVKLVEWMVGLNILMTLATLMLLMVRL